MTVKIAPLNAKCSLLALFLSFLGPLQGVCSDSALANQLSWSGHFKSADDIEKIGDNFWGRENLSFYFDKKMNTDVIKVLLPKGTIDPGSVKREGRRRGGAGFKLRVLPKNIRHAILSYRIRFGDNFDYVKGGKLPGLFGGKGNSGGDIPDGTDGFSFRLMWESMGKGCVYAYIPSSVKFGTPLLSGMFRFIPGKWHTVRQELVLNNPKKSDGVVRLWLDDVLIGEVAGLTIRTVDRLTIEGLFFDVFFGGGDLSWASSRDNYIDFSDFEIRVAE